MNSEIKQTLLYSAVVFSIPPEVCLCVGEQRKVLLFYFPALHFYQNNCSRGVCWWRRGGGGVRPLGKCVCVLRLWVITIIHWRSRFICVFFFLCVAVWMLTGWAADRKRVPGTTEESRTAIPSVRDLTRLFHDQAQQCTHQIGVLCCSQELAVVAVATGDIDVDMVKVTSLQWNV